MNYFRTAALAATAGLALLATSVSANTSQCEFRASEEFPIGNPAGVAISNSQAMEQLINSPRGQSLLASSPAECRGFVISESMRISGLMPAAPLVPNVKMRIAIPTRFTAPQPVVFAPQPLPPANTGTASPGGGAMLDARDDELSRRIAALEDGGGNSTELAALRADLASLRAERSQASQPVVRNTTRVVRETRVVNQGLNDKDREELGLWTRTRGSFSSAITRLFGTGEDNPKTEVREDGIIGGLQATDVNHEGRIAANEAKLSSWWMPQWWWFIPLLLIVALVALIITAVGSRGLAEKTDLDTKADSTTVTDLSKRVDEIDARLTDTEHQVGKKIVALAPDLDVKIDRMRENDELTTAVVVDGEIFEAQLRKGAGSEVFIVSGVNGQKAENAVMAHNLNRVLRKAAYDGRLVVKAIP